MKVFIAGAHGQIGQQLVTELIENDYSVIAGYRDVAAQAPQQTDELTPVHLDLTSPVAEIATAMAGADAVIFAAGSRGHALLPVDLDGAVKTMQAAEMAGITRFVQLSTLDAELRDRWPADMNDYYIAKYYADEWLRRNTALDYVIVQPASLTNDEPTGAIAFNPDFGATITRADVATVLIEVLDSAHHRQTLKIANGTLPIAQALG